MCVCVWVHTEYKLRIWSSLFLFPPNRMLYMGKFYSPEKSLSLSHLVSTPVMCHGRITKLRFVVDS